MSTYWISLHGDDCGSVKWQWISIILNLYDLVPIRRYPIINTNDDYVYYVCWCIYVYDLPPAFNEITYWSLIYPLEDIQESFKNPLSVLLSINLVENINTHHYDINTNRWIREKILKQYKIKEHIFSILCIVIKYKIHVLINKHEMNEASVYMYQNFDNSVFDTTSQTPPVHAE